MQHIVFLPRLRRIWKIVNLQSRKQRRNSPPSIQIIVSSDQVPRRKSCRTRENNHSVVLEGSGKIEFGWGSRLGDHFCMRGLQSCVKFEKSKGLNKVHIQQSFRGSCASSGRWLKTSPLPAQGLVRRSSSSRISVQGREAVGVVHWALNALPLWKLIKPFSREHKASTRQQRHQP
jgi:hypothetical protein